MQPEYETKYTNQRQVLLGGFSQQAANCRWEEDGKPHIRIVKGSVIFPKKDLAKGRGLASLQSTSFWSSVADNGAIVQKASPVICSNQNCWKMLGQKCVKSGMKKM